jgi:DNA-binding transcriptional MerR regulator
MNIGEFARRSHLSPKALRLYDELDLLRPARVESGSGYRLYEAEQLEQARLVAAMRQLQMPLAEIKVVLGLEPGVAAKRIEEYWASVEVEHSARQDLADYLVERLSGMRSVMYEVNTREIPARSVLCLKRNVEGVPGAWALGKEFIALLKQHSLPLMEGRAGAAFCIYWGEVNEDSDGPLEWCRPIPEDQAKELASQLPELTLRSEPAHREAFVDLGPGGQISPAQWQLVTESLLEWGVHQREAPFELGARVTYLVSGSMTEGNGPDCDFAVPIG